MCVFVCVIFQRLQYFKCLVDKRKDGIRLPLLFDLLFSLSDGTLSQLFQLPRNSFSVLAIPHFPPPIHNYTNLFLRMSRSTYVVFLKCIHLCMRTCDCTSHISFTQRVKSPHRLYLVCKINCNLLQAR